jgi:hypothetical protein
LPVPSKKLFDFHNGFYELDKRYNPYVICGRDCAVRALKFVRSEYKSDLPVSFVFEAGDEGRGLLVNEMVASGLSAPIF